MLTKNTGYQLREDDGEVYELCEIAEQGSSLGLLLQIPFVAGGFAKAFEKLGNWEQMRNWTDSVEWEADSGDGESCYGTLEMQLSLD